MPRPSSTVRVAVTILTLLLLLTSARLEAASVTLAWDPSPDPAVTGYRLLFGTTSRVYTAQVDVGKRTQYSLLAIPEGTYYFVVVAYDANALTSDPSEEVTAVVKTKYFAASTAPDLDGDRRSDLAVWRASNGAWDWLSSVGGLTNAAGSGLLWGNAALGDVPLSGDIDGDRLADLIVWRASTGTWYWLSSSSGYTAAGSKEWGRLSLGDKPMLADVDGDGVDDLIIWRSSDGTWYWLTSSTDYDYAFAGAKQWGRKDLGDVPMTGDFDADGRADLAIWRASDGTWYWLNSSSGYAYQTAGAKQWGRADLGDIPLAGDFDGDHRTDLAIWRASTGTWYWLTSTSAYSYASAYGIQWGNLARGDVPALTDLDGDSKADLTVWRASTGAWYWLNSSTGYSYASSGARIMGLSSATDVPVVK